jgi:peptide/nickel transport system permease protein
MPKGPVVTSISSSVARGLESLRVIWSYPSGVVGLFVVLLFVALALFAPLVAPHGPFDVVYNADHSVVRLAPPNWRAWLGTTNQGMDVFSQLVWGSRVALLVGLLSAIGSALIGTLIGLVSGYFGGWVDEVLMRATDIAFGIPFLPFAMVVIAIAKPSLPLVILLVVLFLWRTTARVIRSQVLSLKSRGFVWAARAAGASDTHILWRQILPHVLPISFLYMAIGVQAGVMLEAALSFLGFGDPNVQSWGIMLNAAFRAGAMRSAWWWVLPPGVALSMFVIAVFMITRAFEDRLNPQLGMV